MHEYSEESESDIRHRGPAGTDRMSWQSLAQELGNALTHNIMTEAC